MESITRFFEYLHDVDFPYVVLRNFENLPYSVQTGSHGDLDLLVYDLKHFLEIFPAKPVYPPPRVQYKMNIGGVNIYMDLRHLGDGYYPLHLEQAILENREYNEKGFFTPDPFHFRIALAYHAVHHKNENTYQKWLGDAKIPEMLEALKRSNIGYCKPEDHSVGAFNQYWKGATAIVSREGDSVLKKQVGWSGYNLIDNEFRILSKVTGRHFPKVEKTEDGIKIEDCGERLKADNLPEDWQEQLWQILRDLKANRIQHRDIKPDNLMVRDGTIRLVDFGWSRFESDPKDSPPECLGYPYKPSWGYEDAFSMRKVMKEIQFQIEEAKCES